MTTVTINVEVNTAKQKGPFQVGQLVRSKNTGIKYYCKGFPGEGMVRVRSVQGGRELLVHYRMLTAFLG